MTLAFKLGLVSHPQALMRPLIAVLSLKARPLRKSKALISTQFQVIAIHMTITIDLVALLRQRPQLLLVLKV